jgi:hypothetical protein
MGIGSVICVYKYVCKLPFSVLAAFFTLSSLLKLLALSYVSGQSTVWHSAEEIYSQENKLLYIAQFQPCDEPHRNPIHNCHRGREPVSFLNTDLYRLAVLSTVTSAIL